MSEDQLPGDVREELEVLRRLREAVDALDTLMLFKVHGVRAPSGQEAVRVEVTIESWDNLMDAIGDVERFDLDKGERS